jgi:hypothetical protein
VTCDMWRRRTERWPLIRRSHHSHPPPPAAQDDDAKMKEAGVKIGTAMCRALLDAGVKGLHFYTLNLEKVRDGRVRDGVRRDTGRHGA